MILRIGLEIRIPFCLLAEDDFAINHGCGFAIAATEVKADATTAKMPTERRGRSAFGWNVARADDFNRAIKHFLPDDLGIKPARGIVAIMRGESGDKIGWGIAINSRATARPQEKLGDAFEVLVIRIELICRFGKNLRREVAYRTI